MRDIGSMTKLWSYFEGECSPYPLALFRIAFYCGLALHFGPSIAHFRANYGVAVDHGTAWHALDTLRWLPEEGARAAFALSAIVGIILGVAGIFPRVAAALAGLGCYALACVGSDNTQTLALSYVWFVSWTWSVTGGGDEVLSVAARVRAGVPRRATRLTRSLISAHLAIAFFFAGVQKLHAGWLTRDAMATLLKYPEFTILRPWAVGLADPWAAAFGKALDIGTLLVELGVPIALFVSRWRSLALAAMTMFFVSILALMEVPPLFGVLFCGAALLLADDLALERSWARILKLRNRVRPILQAVTMASTSMICGGCSADSIEPGSVALPVVYGSDSRQVTSSRPTTTAAGGKGAFRGVDEIERRHDRGERGKAR